MERWSLMILRSALRLFGSARRGLAFSALALAALPVIALTNGLSGCLAVGSVGAECTVNSDCSELGGLICASQQCHTPCTTSADCVDKDYPICVHNDRDEWYCDERRGCSTEEDVTATEPDCPSGQLCAKDNYCTPTCVNGTQCALDQICQEGLCVPREKASATAGSAAVGETCFINSDCKSWLCLDGFCRGCKLDIDCQAGRACETNQDPGGRCEPVTCDDCSSALGKVLLQQPQQLLAPCPGSEVILGALQDCIGKAASSCKDNLCAYPPKAPSKDCMTDLQTLMKDGNCAAQLSDCMSY